MKSLHVLLLVVISTTLFHLGFADYAFTCQNDVIFVQDVGKFTFRYDRPNSYGAHIPSFDGPTLPQSMEGEVAVTCHDKVISVLPMDASGFSDLRPRDGKSGRILLQADTDEQLIVHITTCTGNEIYDANLASGELKISEKLEGPRRVLGCENGVHYIHDKNRGRRDAKIGVHISTSNPKPCNIIRGVSSDQVATEVNGHTVDKLRCVNVGNTPKAIMIGSERYESLSCDNSGWKGKPIGVGGDLVEIVDDNFVLTMSCADYSGNEPANITPSPPPATTAMPTMPPTIPSTPTTEDPTTSTAVEQPTPYPIDYTRAHQLISCKQDIIFVQDPAGLQVSGPVKSVYLGGKVAITCKNDVIFVVQPCGSARTISSVNANGEAVKVLLNANEKEQLTSIQIITCKDNELYAANLASDELQIHEKFDFDNLTIWCENNVHHVKDKRTGKIIGEKRGRSEAKIGMSNEASEITDESSLVGRRK